jgi:glycosyltransferase involved in cell wall biosynthesis
MTVTEKRVFGWLADEAGCGWYRLIQPFAHLGGGWSGTCSTRLPRKGIDDNEDGQGDADWSDYDIVVGQRVCKPGTSALWQRVCRSGKVATVFELDDDLLALDDDNPAKPFFDRPDIRANLVANLRAADTVTVTTPALAEAVAPFNPNVHVLPNYVDASVLEIPRPTGDDRAGAGVVVGWQGSATHAADFALVWPHLDRLLCAVPKAWLALFGKNYVPERARARKLAAGRLVWHDWVSSDWPTYYAKVAMFDVGLAPLRDTPFTRAKSGLKAVEYAALGIPAVVSPSPAYREVVEHGVTGLVVRADHEWFSRLRRLVNDDQLRTDMGEAARERAAALTYQGNAWRWREVYAALLD